MCSNYSCMFTVIWNCQNRFIHFQDQIKYQNRSLKTPQSYQSRIFYVHALCFQMAWFTTNFHRYLENQTSSSDANSFGSHPNLSKMGKEYLWIRIGIFIHFFILFHSFIFQRFQFPRDWVFWKSRGIKIVKLFQLFVLTSLQAFWLCGFR